MPEFDINLTTLLAIWMGAAVLMVPLLALAVRLAIVPTLEAVARLRQAERDARRDGIAADRLARMEAEILELTRAVRELEAEKAVSFHA